MLKSMKFPTLLPAVLCVLSVMLCPLVLTFCPGNGEVDGRNDDDTYTPDGRINGRGY